MIIDSQPKIAEAIPVIDLTGSFSADDKLRRAVAIEIRMACREIGFFYISHHGIPSTVLQELLALARDFFALPADEKRKVDIALSSCSRGYEGLSEQILDEGSPPDLKEGFGIGCDLNEEPPYVKAGIIIPAPINCQAIPPVCGLSLRPLFST